MNPRAKQKPRCTWAGSDPLMQQYHDHEWGLPQSNSRALWELMLEGFQAGLSWITDQKKAARLIGNSVKCRLESDSLDVYT